MAWTTKAGERPPDPKPDELEELPYPPAIPLRAKPAKPPTTRSTRAKDKP
jgi:hypothetical protein